MCNGGVRAWPGGGVAAMSYNIYIMIQLQAMPMPKPERSSVCACVCVCVVFVRRSLTFLTWLQLQHVTLQEIAWLSGKSAGKANN